MRPPTNGWDRRLVPRAPALFALLAVAGCGSSGSDAHVLTADLPLHLEDHLDAATISGSELPADGPESIGWSFDEPQPDWKAASAAASRNPMQATPADDALRVILTDADRSEEIGDILGAGIYIDFPGLLLLEPAHLVVRARTESAGLMSVVFDDLGETSSPRRYAGLFQELGEASPLIADGTVQSYLLPLDTQGASGEACCRFGVVAGTYEPGRVDILSVRVVSKQVAFAGDPLGVMTVVDESRQHRRTMFTHTPGRVAFTVRVPPGGRLDVGLGVLQDDAPVDFRVMVAPERGEERRLLEETLADRTAWVQRSIDLSAFEGQTVTLALQADAPMPGSVALWAAPTLSGSPDAPRPNVVFYIIDGAAAELMSVYGYNRRTTPNLERLAAEGAVFEQAYSNATWTYPSTPSFMTSLQTSVLSGDPLPEQAVTMAEHMHRGGYQTAVFTANPYAGTMNGLDRGVDVLRETWAEFDYPLNHSTSSVPLHEAFWRWREEYAGQPYWVHFQTVDTHADWRPVPPFAGLFGSVDAAQRLGDWESQLEEAGLGLGASARTAVPLPRRMEFFEQAGVDPAEYINLSQGLYDEGMAHNDYQIGRLVNRIKAAGEWDNTIFILAADHSHDNAGLRSLASMAAPYWAEQAIFSPWESRIPMIVVWPARIAAGQRFSHPVSMIDMLPTIVDLAGLPMPEITQGQSLAPLLLGHEGWEPRPVILAEFYGSSTDTIAGRIDVVDGRWGASLLVNREPSPPEENGRAAPLLLFDLWNDPYVSHSLHEERPELVEKYTEFLEAQFAAHRALAQRFTRSGEGPALTPEQLRTLRALGYIR
jgi:arylsulfatase A-like enzyme